MTTPTFPKLILTLALALATVLGGNLFAQEDGDAKPAAPAAKEAPQENGRFTVPDGNAKELFAFIDKIKRERVRTVQELVEKINAAVAATKKIRAIEGVAVDDEIKAIREQLGALSAGMRYMPTAKQERDALLKELADDKRPVIARLVDGENLRTRVSSARTATKAQLETLRDDVLDFVKGGEIDGTSYQLAALTARAMNAHPEMAADFYETAAAIMKKSDNADIQKAADKMLGSARRLKLPGNFMELKGNTADGEAFDWAAYRGKVVLVDFWASWCGPCRAEIPNMKAALEKYGEKGFAIVGINLDNTKAAYDNYVKSGGISWVSLMSDKEEERGWNNPLAVYYGVNAIPTAILVDKEGKVVSMSARGPELERQLDELLGPAGDGDSEGNEGEDK